MIIRKIEISFYDYDKILTLSEKDDSYIYKMLDKFILTRVGEENCEFMEFPVINFYSYEKEEVMNEV